MIRVFRNLYFSLIILVFLTAIINSRNLQTILWNTTDIVGKNRFSTNHSGTIWKTVLSVIQSREKRFGLWWTNLKRWRKRKQLKFNVRKGTKELRSWGILSVLPWKKKLIRCWQTKKTYRDFDLITSHSIWNHIICQIKCDHQSK